jgi:hypothetical protein
LDYIIKEYQPKFCALANTPVDASVATTDSGGVVPDQPSGVFGSSGGSGSEGVVGQVTQFLPSFSLLKPMASSVGGGSIRKKPSKLATPSYAKYALIAGVAVLALGFTVFMLRAD